MQLLNGCDSTIRKRLGEIVYMGEFQDKNHQYKPHKSLSHISKKHLDVDP